MSHAGRDLQVVRAHGGEALTLEPSTVAAFISPAPASLAHLQ